MQYHNYIDKWTCIAMMNKNCTLLEGDQLGFQKTKNGSKVAVFSLDYRFDATKHKQVNWLYLNEKPNSELSKSAYSLEEIVSKIDVEDFFGENRFKGKKFIEWRGTVNKWDKLLKDGRFCIEDLNSSNVDSTISMIEKWRYLENGGMKYGWQERAGCDKALVKRYVDNYEGIKDYVLGSVFKLNNEVVGYSCIEKKSLCEVDGFPEFKYLTRKVINSRECRNITEYIDYKTLESIYMLNKDLRTFLVNWGASSGGVHWYKTHKFPLCSLQTKWFCSKKV